MNKNKLITRINRKTAKIGVIGLGYVGLPLISRFSEEGFKTIGFDTDQEKVSKLNQSKTYIKHFSSEKIAAAIKTGFRATDDFSKITDIDIILICVPTPLGKKNEPDLSFVRRALESIKLYMKENQLLVLESTTYPGTTEEEIIPLIKNNNFKVGKNYFVGYSPEREDPGNKNYSTKTIPKVVSGFTSNCLEITKTLYDQIVDQTVPVSSPRVAEMTKILENIHRAVNIGLVNELKMVADKMDIDIYEVINAASTKPFGFTPYYPGPGLGGHCIPIDPFYLTWKAKQVGIDTRFIELAGEVNTKMPEWVIDKLKKALEKRGKILKGLKILIAGVAYKKNVDDIRESPALRIIDLLQRAGAIVSYHDPFVPVLKKTRQYNFSLTSVDLNNSLINYDATLLITDHDDLDYKILIDRSELLIDTRGHYKNASMIIKA